MKFLICILLSLTLLTSCQPNNQYTYIESKNDYDLYNNPIIKIKEPEIFEAPNDSVAYCIAVDMFTKSFYATKHTENLLNKHNKPMLIGYPKSFKLITKDSIDIANGLHLTNPNEVIEKIKEKYERLDQDMQ